MCGILMKPKAPDETDSLSLDPEKGKVIMNVWKFIIRN